MEENEDVLQNLQIIFPNNINPNAANINNYPERKSIYLGETVALCAVVARSPALELDWKNRISQFAATAKFSIIDDTNKLKQKSPRKVLNSLGSLFVPCPVAVTVTLASTVASNPIKAEYEHDEVDKAYFLDESHYLYPLQARLDNVEGLINKTELTVTAWMFSTQPDLSPDQLAKKDFHLDNPTLELLRKNIIHQKTVSKILNVINPPVFKSRITSTGEKHLLLTQVCNKSNEKIELLDINILNTASRFNSIDENSSESNSSDENRLYKENISSTVRCIRIGSNQLPITLFPEEEISLIFTLTSQTPHSNIAEMELYFKSQLKWRHNSSTTDVLTVYRLPKYSIQYAPFIISIDCTEDITLGKSFTLTYNIVNKLQDFLSMKLYWNLKQQLLQAQNLGVNNKTIEKLEMMNRAVICHDPDVYVGACPKGSSIPVPVSFEILEPGIFEFSEMMKVNLRYALPDSQSTLKQDSVGTPVSIETTSTLSADDQLAASEELWRDRSGSTSSLNTPISESAEEKRKSFATKSYSFGDLGPTLSTDSDEAKRTKFKNIKRSSAVPPPRPPPPRMLSQIEKDVTNPSNFLKKSFQVYIPG